MDAILEQLKGIIQTLLDMPDLLLACVVMMVVAFGIWRTRYLPNRLIPVMCMGLGACVVPMFIPVKLNAALPNPEVADYVRRVMVGMILGLVSLGCSFVAGRMLMKRWPEMFGPEDAQEKDKQ